MDKIIDKVNTPDDVKGLDTARLEQLCAEIRDYLVECCSRNPGHLGASLGAVEIIVGLHRVYDSPRDNIVFDVSHQAYAHKILTGRRDAFRDARREGGISGFTRRDESPYDAFGAGHASTSISAALGLARAARMQGKNVKTVAVIGDGALTGGLAYEGLNNAGYGDDDILIILNDNNISIDKSTGSLHRYLLKVTTAPGYNRLKDHLWDRIGEGRFRRGVQKWVRATKSFFVKQSCAALFEALGFRYFGPIDGNDIRQVTETLAKLHEIKGPKILHAITLKGKGYAPAEEDQTTWHAPGAFDPSTGKRLSNGGNGRDRYQDVFGQTLLELARSDSRIVGVTPAMASGCGMNILAKEMPERFYDVGIAEEHAVTFSAGLAAGGMKPFCNIYSSFSQRAYDQIIHDVALQKLPVVLCLDRAGLVGEDGATHHGNFDMAAYRSIPDTTIAVPADEAELKDMMYTASLQEEGPFIIRYPRGYGEGTEWREKEPSVLEPGKGILVLDGDGPSIIAAGPCVHAAVRAAGKLEAEKGIRARVYNIRYIKPLDTALIEDAAACGSILTVEDGCIKGGLYGAVCEHLAAAGIKVSVMAAGIPDSFIPHGTQASLRDACGISELRIGEAVAEAAEKLSAAIKK